MWIIAAVACAALMVSCGGEKKNDKKDAPANDKEQVAVDVVAKAKEYVAKVTEAYEAGDEAKAAKIEKEADAWLEGLSEADQEKVLDALRK